MPNRILREGILDSEAVNKLGPQAELFYRRLMSVIDDFGRFDARPTVLRSRCYPLQLSSVREADISRWLAECQAAGLLSLYDVDRKQYLARQKLINCGYCPYHRRENESRRKRDPHDKRITWKG